MQITVSIHRGFGSPSNLRCLTRNWAEQSYQLSLGRMLPRTRANIGTCGDQCLDERASSNMRAFRCPNSRTGPPAEPDLLQESAVAVRDPTWAIPRQVRGGHSPGAEAEDLLRHAELHRPGDHQRPALRLPRRRLGPRSALVPSRALVELFTYI